MSFMNFRSFKHPFSETKGKKLVLPQNKDLNQHDAAKLLKFIQPRYHLKGNFIVDCRVFMLKVPNMAFFRRV